VYRFLGQSGTTFSGAIKAVHYRNEKTTGQEEQAKDRTMIWIIL